MFVAGAGIEPARETLGSTANRASNYWINE